MDTCRSAFSAYLILMVVAAGCGPLPGFDRFYASRNEELKAEASETSAKVDPPPNRDYFVGLALSGGGSRAANFSASVMLELDQLGILEHVQYISAVSGSALPAAYYALFRDRRDKWNRRAVRETMSQCFVCWQGLYLLNPTRLAKLMVTSYDRTDVLAEVFDNRVFDHRTFTDLRMDTPRLILNATNYVKSGGFTFTQREFFGLRSDLGRLRVAVGVIASAAYPGGLPNVTLRDFTEPLEKGHPYLHVFDGGVNDNLGADALTRIHEDHVRALGRQAFPKGCLMILVDAYTPYFQDEAQKQPDTRGPEDLVIDTNALQAFSIFLETKRRRTLEGLGIDESNRDDAAAELPKDERHRRPIGFIEHVKSTNATRQANETDERFQQRVLVQQKRSQCRLWHIALTQIGLPDVFPEQPELYAQDYKRKYEGRLNKKYAEFAKRVRGISTNFRISGQDSEYLHTAGELLVHEPNSRRIICQWLSQVTGANCRS